MVCVTFAAAFPAEEHGVHHAQTEINFLDSDCRTPVFIARVLKKRP
jgi:hypothetical protein